MSDEASVPNLSHLKQQESVCIGASNPGLQNVCIGYSAGRQLNPDLPAVTKAGTPPTPQPVARFWRCVADELSPYVHNAIYESVDKSFCDKPFVLKSYVESKEYNKGYYVPWTPQPGDWIRCDNDDRALYTLAFQRPDDKVWCARIHRPNGTIDRYQLIQFPGSWSPVLDRAPYLEGADGRYHHVDVSAAGPTGPGAPGSDFVDDVLAFYVGVPKSALKQPAPIEPKKKAAAKPFGDWSPCGFNTRGW